MSLTNTELKIYDLIKLSFNESIWLPEFQRPFVWDKNQIRLLVDSLYNNYTISSILLWKGGDELARRRVGANIKDIKIPQNSPESVTYLLDGQQRTTALTLAFTNKEIYRGNNIKKKEKVNIYFDSHYEGDDPEMRWVLDDEKIPNENNPENPFVLKEYSEKELFNVFGTRFVKIKHIFNFDDSIVDEWFDTSITEEEIKMLRFKNEYNKLLKNLEKNILERKVYDIEQKGTLEQVLEVFERINTKNTKLSIFDIMVAKTYRKFDEGYFDLRSYFKVINYKGDVKNDFFQNRDNIDLDKVDMIVDESFMLQLSMIILNKKFKATEILKIRTSDLMENIKYLHDRFHLIIDFMNKHFNISSKELNLYQPIMKFLAAALSHYQHIDIEKQEMLISWFWNTLLKNRYPGAQNERIAKDYKIIQENSNSSLILNLFVRENTRSFSDLENISQENFNLIDAHYSNRSQQIYRALLLLLKSKNAKDFYNGVNPVKTGAISNRLEEHHIFPKNSSLGKIINENYKNHRYNDIINNVANIALITKETNNKRIKNKLPSVYFLEFENEYKKIGKYEDFIQIMDSQFISIEMIALLKEDKFEEFILARTKLLYQQIEKLSDIIISNGKDQAISPSGSKSDTFTSLSSKKITQEIEEVEILLREIVFKELDKESTNPLEEFVSERTKVSVEYKITSHLKKFPGESIEQYLNFRNQLNFFTLGELKEIITNDNNWKYFERYFLVKPSVSNRFHQLFTIRNQIAHNNQLNDIMLKDGEASVLWFKSILNNNKESLIN